MLYNSFGHPTLFIIIFFPEHLSFDPVVIVKCLFYFFFV